MLSADNSSIFNIGALTLTVLIMAIFFPMPGATYSAAQVSEPESPESIIGGVPETVERWPWMVSLVEADNPDALAGHICGGSLVAPDRVLTAGHCVESEGPNEIDVVVGRSKLSDSGTGQRVGVEGISVHPEYPKLDWFPQNDWFSKRPSHDLALLKLDRPLGTRTVRIATPRQSYLSQPGRSGIVLGHGIATPDFSVETSDTLQKGYLTLISDTDCENAYPDLPYKFLPGWMVCAQDLSDPKVTTICHGDSGGPLIVGSARGRQYYQVGVVSWGESGCPPTSPSVFAHVSPNHSFIKTPDADLVFKPYKLSNPQISGSSTVGSTLTCSSGTWGGSPANLQYKWSYFPEDNYIPRATSNTHRVKVEDIGQQLYCGVIAQNSGGYGLSMSNIVSISN